VKYARKLRCYGIWLLNIRLLVGRGRGGNAPGMALLVKRRNSKWFLTNEPEVRFRFETLVKVGPTMRLAGTVPV